MTNTLSGYLKVILSFLSLFRHSEPIGEESCFSFKFKDSSFRFAPLRMTMNGFQVAWKGFFATIRMTNTLSGCLKRFFAIAQNDENTIQNDKYSFRLPEKDSSLSLRMTRIPFRMTNILSGCLNIIHLPKNSTSPLWQILQRLRLCRLGQIRRIFGDCLDTPLSVVEIRHRFRFFGG